MPSFEEPFLSHKSVFSAVHVLHRIDLQGLVRCRDGRRYQVTVLYGGVEEKGINGIGDPPLELY